MLVAKLAAGIPRKMKILMIMSCAGPTPAQISDQNCLPQQFVGPGMLPLLTGQFHLKVLELWVGGILMCRWSDASRVFP